MSSEHDVLMRHHTMIKNHIDLNFVSGKNKFTDFSGHSCDRLVTCPGVPHLSPASAGISSSPEAGKLIFHIETFGQMNSSLSSEARAHSSHLIEASMCHAPLSVLLRLSVNVWRTDTTTPNDRCKWERRTASVTRSNASSELRSFHAPGHTGQSKWWWCRYSLSLTINIYLMTSGSKTPACEPFKRPFSPPHFQFSFSFTFF